MTQEQIQLAPSPQGFLPMRCGAPRPLRRLPDKVRVLTFEIGWYAQICRCRRCGRQGMTFGLLPGGNLATEERY